MIRINKAHPEPLCQGPAYRCFAGAHQADKKNIFIHEKLYPVILPGGHLPYNF